MPFLSSDPLTSGVRPPTSDFWPLTSDLWHLTSDFRPVSTPAANSTFDVAIVGAGPAGSTAARELARGGMRVAVFDKARFPRPKTCGGGLLGRTLDWLELDVSGVVEAACFRAELHHHGPDLSFATERSRPVVSMVMRSEFDTRLLREAAAAGAHVFEGVGLRSVQVVGSRVELDTDAGRVSANFVIGADGANSGVARSGGFPALREIAPALEGELTVPPDLLRRFAGVARFDFGVVPRGYGWVFPKRDHLSVGVLTTRRGACNLNEEYVRYLERLGLGKPLAETRRGYVIPLRPRAGLFARERILLVGDAAGLVDPITAEGISAAVVSGRLAARAVLGGDGAPERVYDLYRRTLEAALLRDLRTARWLARALYDFPRLRAWVFKRRGARLSEFVTRVVMGEARYRQVWKA